MEMALNYDRDVFEKYKALSVQNASEIEVGMTLFSNSYPEEFTVLSIETQKQHDIRHEFELKENYKDGPAWLGYGENKFDQVSLSDRNVTSSYNPWMLFKDKETMITCREELTVSYENDPYEFDYDDYSYDYGYDEMEELNDA